MPLKLAVAVPELFCKPWVCAGLTGHGAGRGAGGGHQVCWGHLCGCCVGLEIKPEVPMPTACRGHPCSLRSPAGQWSLWVANVCSSRKEISPPTSRILSRLCGGSWCWGSSWTLSATKGAGSQPHDRRLAGSLWLCSQSLQAQQMALKKREGGQKSQVRGPLLSANTLQLELTPLLASGLSRVSSSRRPLGFCSLPSNPAAAEKPPGEGRS